MQTHTLQVRDLIEMLQHQDPAAGVVIETNDETLSIATVGRHCDTSRDVAIKCDSDASKIEELRDRIDSLRGWLDDSRRLLEEFVTIWNDDRDAGSHETSMALDRLLGKVESHISIPA